MRLDDIEPISVVDGTLLWRPVRRTLDIGAFGINAYVAPRRATTSIEEHTERSLGHEEVYVVFAGRATFTLDDDTLDAPAGTVVFVRERDVKRHARAEEPETTVLAIGGPRGASTSRRPGRTTSPPSGIAQPGTTTRISTSWRLLSNADPITRERCTTSPAPRRCRARRRRASPSCAGPRAETRVDEHAASVDEDFASLRERPDWPLA